jgi:hypothetical protein
VTSRRPRPLEAAPAPSVLAGLVGPVGPPGPCRGHPARSVPFRGCQTGPMPVLDPNPQNGQKKMLIVFGSFFAIFIVIAVIATLASP